MHLAWINYADDATLTGGSWQATMPRANLQQPGLFAPARSANATVGATKIDVDFGASNTFVIRLAGFMAHGLSQDATWRITGGDTFSATTLDTGWIDAWPSVYGPYDRDFEHDDWFMGTLTEEEAANYSVMLLHDFGSNQLYRYYRFEFSDTTNSAGYIDLYRLWMGPVWSVDVGYAWGAALGWQSRDKAVQTLSGARYSLRRPPARQFRLTLPAMTDDEAYGQFLEMAREVRSEGELIVIPDPDDAENAHRRNVYGRVVSYGDGAVARELNMQSGSLTVEQIL